MKINAWKLVSQENLLIIAVGLKGLITVLILPSRRQVQSTIAIFQPSPPEPSKQPHL